MKKSRWPVVALILFALLVVAPGIATAAGSDFTGSVQSVQAMQSAETPVLTGDIWRRMSDDAKVAFVWGVGQGSQIDYNIRAEAGRATRAKSDDFSDKVVEGMSGMSMNRIVNTIDTYYQTHPDRLQQPVMQVMWDNVIRPNLKTAAGGRSPR